MIGRLQLKYAAARCVLLAYDLHGDCNVARVLINLASNIVCAPSLEVLEEITDE
jgi:hypothetical protein